MFVVAGVTGHVGSAVAKELLAKGQKVKVVVRSADKGAAWSKQGAEIAVGSLDDASFFAATLKGAAGCFVLLPPNFAVADIYAEQRRTADAIASAVKTSGVPHVVMLSSIGADVAEKNGPIRGLNYLENALRATGTKLTAVRAGSFQENVGNSIGAAKAMGIYPNFSPNADMPLPMIATRDIGAFAAKQLIAAPARSETIDLVGPSYSARQLAEKLGAALGKTIQVVDVPESGWVQGMMQGGMPKHAAEVLADMYAGANSGVLMPRGDRIEHGTTPIDDVIKAVAR